MKRLSGDCAVIWRRWLKPKAISLNKLIYSIFCVILITIYPSHYIYVLQQPNVLQLDENILKTLTQRNVLPTHPNKRIKLIYDNRFKTSNFVINNNSSRSIGVSQKTNVIYQFKCPLGGGISENNNIYVGLT